MLLIPLGSDWARRRKKKRKGRRESRREENSSSPSRRRPPDSPTASAEGARGPDIPEGKLIEAERPEMLLLNAERRVHGRRKWASWLSPAPSPRAQKSLSSVTPATAVRRFSIPRRAPERSQENGCWWLEAASKRKATESEGEKFSSRTNERSIPLGLDSSRKVCNRFFFNFSYKAHSECISVYVMMTFFSHQNREKA